MQSITLLSVNQARLWQRHMRLARIGATPGGGVNRQAMTDGDRQAHGLISQWGAEIGLTPFVDTIGNLYLHREGSNPALAPILAGSHLDTQPSGGKFDGAFGVLAALEALTRLHENQLTTRAPIELVVWNNEEGCRFKPTTMGSSVFAGALDLETALQAIDSQGTTVTEIVDNLIPDEGQTTRRQLGFPVSGYLEPHIEQGPLLEQQGCPVGVVSGIQGLRWFTVDVLGEAGHAGTTPHAKRRDALLASVQMLQALQAHFQDPDDAVRFTVGQMHVSPNSPNTIAEHVRFTIDFRHPEQGVLDKLGDGVAQVCRAAVDSCDVEVMEGPASPPIDFDAAVVGVLKEITETLGYSYKVLQSGATHDAKWLSQIAPSGMIFVPCENGISHNEREAAEPQALAAGATVLVNALVRMANADEFAST